MNNNKIEELRDRLNVLFDAWSNEDQERIFDEVETLRALHVSQAALQIFSLEREILRLQANEALESVGRMLRK